MDEKNRKLLKTDEKIGNRMNMDENGQKRLKTVEKGWKRMNTDESGWKRMKKVKHNFNCWKWLKLVETNEPIDTQWKW